MNQQNEANREKNAPVRRPRQERGKQRIKLILDAAARVIVEKGVENLTIQNLSKEAQTAPGSLYHFFPDLDAVIRSLEEYHKKNIDALVAELEENSSAEKWRHYSPQEFAETLFLPYSRYLVSHRDYLPVLKLRGFLFNESKYLVFVRKVFHWRYPDWPEDNIINETDFVHSVATGTLQQSFQRSDKMAYDFIPKIMSLLALHVASIDNTAVRPIGQNV